jgi:sucrose-6-phosphate hydrolase SacC (GH32 family)
MKEDIFTPISYDVHAGNVQGLGLQKYDFGQFYASKTFYDPAKKRQILWGWVAEEGRAPHQGEDWSSIQSLPRSVLIDPTNTTRLMFPPIDELESLRGAAIAIPTTLVKAGETVDLSKLVPASTGNQLDVELTISGDFTQPNLAAGISVLNSATSDADAQLTTVPVQRLMNNTDMPGDDIIAKHHSPGDPDFGPLPCQAACDALPACKSWTWVVRGTPVGSGDCCL